VIAPRRLGSARRTLTRSGHRLTAVWIASILFGASSGAAASAKKLVYYGWGIPTAAHVAAHVAEIEQMPFDGTAIQIPVDQDRRSSITDETGNRLGLGIFSDHRLQADQFGNAIAQLGATRWTRFTDNFLVAVVSTAAEGRDFSWFDDARWDTIAGNWRLLLKIARRARARGIIFDPEDYGGRIFDYQAMTARRPGTFAEYQAIARARGSQLTHAGKRVFPALVILALYGPSLPLDARTSGAVAAGHYALYPAFVSGLLEGADPAFRFVDGGEYSYGYGEPSDFARLRDTMTDRLTERGLLPFVESGGLQHAFALWLDKGGRERWFPEDPSRNYFSPARFEAALRAALAASDEYVWVYSQVARFFPPSALPGPYVDAIRRARSSSDSRSAP
jgi:hypothetical protein